MSVTFANDSGVKQSSQILEKAEEKVSLLAIPRQHILDAAWLCCISKVEGKVVEKMPYSGEAPLSAALGFRSGPLLPTAFVELRNGTGWQKAQAESSPCSYNGMAAFISATWIWNKSAVMFKFR